MSTITTRVEGSDRVVKKLKRIPDAMFTSAKAAIAKATFEAHAEVTKNASGTKLNRRTGALARSFQTRVSGTKVSNLRGEVYTDSIYAPIQEYGGTIRAKSKYLSVPGGPYLNIPTTFNQTPAGAQRLSARNVFDRKGHIVRSSTGKYVVMMNGMPMFWLVKKVTIPERLGMRSAQRRQIRPLLDTLQQLFEQEARK